MSNFILNSVDSANDDIEGYKMMKAKVLGSHSDFKLNLAERIAELNGKKKFNLLRKSLQEIFFAKI